MNDQTLLAIVGPTAVGKTALSIKLAQVLNGEIVNADSMQVYKGMDIGTAKPTANERAQVPHHLVDICDPTEPWSVATFQKQALETIAAIRKRGKLPIMVGGTGLYVQAITHELSFSKADEDHSYRLELEAYADTKGNDALHKRLMVLDQKAAAVIHPNNRRRVIRALEVIHTTGTSFSEGKQELSNPRFLNILVGLMMDREQLYCRINDRVDAMMNAGLLEEVKHLFKQGIEGQAIQAIGYKELYAYLNHECTLENAIEAIKTNSRQYAKRQLTWFRNKTDAEWFDTGEEPFDEVVTKVLYFSCRKMSDQLEL